MSWNCLPAELRQMIVQSLLTSILAQDDVKPETLDWFWTLWQVSYAFSSSDLQPLLQRFKDDATEKLDELHQDCLLLVNARPFVEAPLRFKRHCENTFRNIRRGGKTINSNIERQSLARDQYSRRPPELFRRTLLPPGWKISHPRWQNESQPSQST